MRLFGIVIALFVAAGCTSNHGERCNPSEYSDNGIQGDCVNGFACVYPTAPMCGVAYCCTVDPDGNITDTLPNCQPDPTAADQCMLDLGTTD